jgi:ribosomal protein S18 acetylase RimI-like enzyme
MNRSARYRSAQESDALDLACLIDSASRGLASWFWSTLCEPGQSLIEVGRNLIRIKSDSPLYYNAWMVAEINGAVAGALTGRLIPIPYQRGDDAELADAIFAPLIELHAAAAGSWYMTALAVHAEYRGSGLGSSLVSKAEETAHAAGASQVSLSVEEANTGAVKFYLRHGFIEWTRRPYVPFPGSRDEGDWILLRKQIAR